MYFEKFPQGGSTLRKESEELREQRRFQDEMANIQEKVSSPSVSTRCIPGKMDRVGMKEIPLYHIQKTNTQIIPYPGSRRSAEKV